MNFSQALELLKEGQKLTRSGWNGNRPLPPYELKSMRMWIVLLREYEVEIVYGHELNAMTLHPFIADAPSEWRSSPVAGIAGRPARRGLGSRVVTGEDDLSDDDLVYEDCGQPSWPMRYTERIWATTLRFRCPSCNAELSYCPTEDEDYDRVCEYAAHLGLEYTCASCETKCFLFFASTYEVRISCGGLRVEKKQSLRSPSMLDRSLDEDEIVDFLSIRCRALLDRAGIRFVGDLVTRTQESLRAIPGVGAATLHEIRRLLATMSLSFGMEVDWESPTPEGPHLDTTRVANEPVECSQERTVPSAFDGSSAALIDERQP